LGLRQDVEASDIRSYSLEDPQDPSSHVAILNEVFQKAHMLPLLQYNSAPVEKDGRTAWSAQCLINNEVYGEGIGPSKRVAKTWRRRRHAKILVSKL